MKKYNERNARNIMKYKYNEATKHFEEGRERWGRECICNGGTFSRYTVHIRGIITVKSS
jgi:hypothetical protein